jgi:hypothetical protein
MLWEKASQTRVQAADAYLIFDDTVVDKSYSLIRPSLSANLRKFHEIQLLMGLVITIRGADGINSGVHGGT